MGDDDLSYMTENDGLEFEQEKMVSVKFDNVQIQRTHVPWQQPENTNDEYDNYYEEEPTFEEQMVSVKFDTNDTNNHNNPCSPISCEPRKPRRRSHQKVFSRE